MPILYSRRLPEDGSLVRKHVEVNTYDELCYMICILWYFIGSIFWLIYGMSANARYE
jgi:hypothetical protein